MTLASRVAGKNFSKHSTNGKKASCVRRATHVRSKPRPAPPSCSQASQLTAPRDYADARRWSGCCLMRVLRERTQLDAVPLALRRSVLAGEAHRQVRLVHGPRVAKRDKREVYDVEQPVRSHACERGGCEPGAERTERLVVELHLCVHVSTCWRGSGDFLGVCRPSRGNRCNRALHRESSQGFGR